MNALIRIWLLTTACCCLAMPGLAQVGVTTAASGEPRGTPPAQPERILQVGVDVQANERITTRNNDRAQLVFLDGSALTVGPDSDLVIDRYVYDPNRKVGDLAVSVSRGVFRFVGGAISKKSEVIVRTPSAHIGIRGGIMMIAIGSDGSAVATFLYGDAMTVTGQGVTSKATRAGSQILVPYDKPPQPPIVLPPGSLQSFIAMFEQMIGNSTAAAGDDALVNAMLAALNSSLGPEGGGTNAWFSYLQAAGNQALTISNASRPPPGAPAPTKPVQSAPPPQAPPPPNDN
ncbi:MAG: FecR family protein [Reyranella sp.]|nr:FecR family protein [Reyranella sp.]